MARGEGGCKVCVHVLFCVYVLCFGSSFCFFLLCVCSLVALLSVFWSVWMLFAVCLGCGFFDYVLLLFFLFMWMSFELVCMYGLLHCFFFVCKFCNCVVFAFSFLNVFSSATLFSVVLFCVDFLCALFSVFCVYDI